MSPIEQPQAYKFYSLLNVSPDSFAVVTQPAQVREVDRNVYKYVGTNGIDHSRIVQVGNRLDFGDSELLSQTHASTNADVSAVIEGNLSANMRVIAVPDPNMDKSRYGDAEEILESLEAFSPARYGLPEPDRIT